MPKLETGAGPARGETPAEPGRRRGLALQNVLNQGAVTAWSAGIAFYDSETTTQWSYNADAWFHAASTMKMAVLLGV